MTRQVFWIKWDYNLPSLTDYGKNQEPDRPSLGDYGFPVGVEGADPIQEFYFATELIHWIIPPKSKKPMIVIAIPRIFFAESSL